MRLRVQIFIIMKRFLLLAVMVMSLGLASHAQTETKVKPTSSVKQSVHNTFHKHKHHNGYKVKSTKNGVTHVKKVKTETAP